MDWFFEPSVIGRVLFSVVLGGAVGLEREIHGRPAGLRTHVMVCLGATIMILASEFTRARLDAASVVVNPDRVAAGIVTGIGFLGAGAIIREENMVRGLTTAGCIWFVAGLGIVVGKAYYFLALWATLTALVVLIVFRYFEERVPILKISDLCIRLATDNFESAREQCAKILSENDYVIEEKKLVVDQKEQEAEIKYRVKTYKGEDQETITMRIARIPGVMAVSW